MGLGVEQRKWVLRYVGPSPNEFTIYIKNHSHGEWITYDTFMQRDTT